MLLKRAARAVLHSMGGLAVLRGFQRRASALMMFHSFTEADQTNLDALCSAVTRHYHPVSLNDIAEARSLPDNPVTVTVDDAYRSYFLYAHPIFLRHKIPVTVYAVGGFSDGQLWLWPDQIGYGLEHSPHTSVVAEIAPGNALELNLSTPASRERAFTILSEALKLVADENRLSFLGRYGSLMGVEIPPVPPTARAAMSWDELRAAAADGVEIGCHTQTHPILSRVASPAKLEREIRGAKAFLEFHLRAPVRHFCYPNGRAIDIGADAAALVLDSGFISATTTAWGLNPIPADAMNLRRIPLGSDTGPRHGIEQLAGLHLPSN
jgi:peptidoglycan/xylan/chitin deacetylase (PgdA/CDA1 family)